MCVCAFVSQMPPVNKTLKILVTNNIHAELIEGNNRAKLSNIYKKNKHF